MGFIDRIRYGDFDGLWRDIRRSDKKRFLRNVLIGVAAYVLIYTAVGFMVTIGDDNGFHVVYVMPVREGLEHTIKNSDEFIQAQGPPEYSPVDRFYGLLGRGDDSIKEGSAFEVKAVLTGDSDRSNVVLELEYATDNVYMLRLSDVYTHPMVFIDDSRKYKGRTLKKYKIGDLKAGEEVEVYMVGVLNNVDSLNSLVGRSVNDAILFSVYEGEELKGRDALRINICSKYGC